MGSVRIIQAATEGKGGRKPRSNRRRTTPPPPSRSQDLASLLPVARRTADEDGARQGRPTDKARRDPPKPKPDPIARPEPPEGPALGPRQAAAVPAIWRPTPLAVPHDGAISMIELSRTEPGLAEAILMALEAYEALRRPDDTLTPVATF